MLAQLRTFALLGIDAVPVDVEVDTSPAQQPKTVIVGLPEAAVRESIHRIERALVNLGYRLPYGRTVINLAPADLRKDAGAFDLPESAKGVADITRLIAFKQAIGDQTVRARLTPAAAKDLELATRKRPLALTACPPRALAPAEGTRWGRSCRPGVVRTVRWTRPSAWAVGS